MLTLIISALILAALIGVAAGYWLRKRDEEPDTVRDVAPITQRSNWYTNEDAVRVREWSDRNEHGELLVTVPRTGCGCGPRAHGWPWIDDEDETIPDSAPCANNEPIRITPNGTPISQTGYQK